MVKNYRVKATGRVGQNERVLMEVDVSASTKRDAIASAQRRKLDYFDAHDYEPRSLRWEARETEV